MLYYVFFIKYLCISKTSLVTIGLKAAGKSFRLSFNYVILILLIVKSFEILPKHCV